MRIYRIIQRLSVLFLLCLVSVAVQGQTDTAGPFKLKSRQFSMDLRHINWAEFEGILPNQAATTRGTDSGKKWIDRIGNMPDYLNDFYQVYGDKVKEVMNGGENWLSDPTKGDDDSYSGGDYESLTYSVNIKTIKGSVDFTFPSGSSQDVIAQKAAETVNVVCDNIVSEFDCFIRYLILCLNYDFPEAFWTGNGARWGFGCSYGYSYTYAGTGTVEYTIPLSFTLQTRIRQISTGLENVFDYRIAGFQTQKQVSEGVTEFKTKVQAVSDLFKGKSRYEQVAGLDDWLTKHNSYNSDLQSGVPA